MARAGSGQAESARPAELRFDGQVLSWRGYARFKASSGLPGYQTPEAQCDVEKGPTPEGVYVIPFPTKMGPLARIDPNYVCKLVPGEGWERIPTGTSQCRPIFANWGDNRLHFSPANTSTRNKCHPVSRSGFYIHDSTKGFTHGCIETEVKFFEVLAGLIWAGKRRAPLVLEVKYVPGRPTNGGTKIG